MAITVYSWLKNTDLHALSAYEALTGLMHQTDVSGIYRLKKWTIETSEASLKRVLDETYYLINPNKEAYFINELPSSIKSPYYLVEVIPHSGSDRKDLISKIQTKTGIQIQKIDLSMIWIVKFKNSPPSLEVFESTIVKTTSLGKGILTNPLYEASICSLN